MPEALHDTSLPILIVGAGLSGLSLAAVLTNRRVPFILLEADARHTYAQDYSVTLRRSAYEPLLRALDEVNMEAARHAFGLAVTVDASIGGIGRVGEGVTDASTGETLAPAVTSEHEDCVRANRTRLREWLIERIGEENVRRQATLAQFWNDHQHLVVQLEGGEQVRGRCLVAADGMHSTVRSILLPSAIPKPLPVVTYNWQRTLPRHEYENSLAPAFRNTTVLLGTTHGIGIESAIVDMDERLVKMSWTLRRKYDATEPQSLRQDQIAIYADIRSELDQFGNLVPPLDYLADRPLSENDQLSHWPVRSLRISMWDLDRTCEKKVFVIGDAAHAMPLLAVEGANHGLADGVQLAAILTDAGNGEPVSRIGRRFYDGAAERWYQSIEASETMIESVHQARQT